MPRNGNVVVPQRVIDALGPRLARSTRPNRNPGAVMAEELYRDDDMRPVLAKAITGASLTAAEKAKLTAVPLVAGTWDEAFADLGRS